MRVAPQWMIDALDTDVRLRVSRAEAGGTVSIGIADQADVSAYLSGVAHDEVREINRRTVILRPRSGGETIDPPERETFWAVSASGVGTQEIVWPATAGRWAAVVMNADRSPGITADIDVGIRAGFVWPLAVGLIAAGLLGASVGAGLIAVGAIGLSATEASSSPARVIGAHDLGDTVDGSPRSPVRLEARLDPALSRWRWLIKWFLATPHYVILVFLWVGFAVVTLIAGIAILFTGRYPDWAFAYTSGVLRWSWRVNYYAMTGGIGTDQYPPFRLGPDPGYPATLEIDPPGQLSRGLVLVKWWLLAIPHYLITGLITGGMLWVTSDGGTMEIGGGGLLGLLTLIAGGYLLLRNRYPKGLFDLIIGLNRWVVRVTVYAALMTDSYPPFRLDQGGSEPVSDPSADREV